MSEKELELVMNIFSWMDQNNVYYFDAKKNIIRKQQPEPVQLWKQRKKEK